MGPRSEPLGTEDALGLMKDLGFLLVPAVPVRDMPAYLLVALRPHPTLRHYDPEAIEFWVEHEGRGLAQSVDHTTHLPIDAPFSWGPIRIVDRIGATNEYLTFGGRLSAMAREGTRVFVFSSPAPLLERGGHSQGWDLGAQELAAFFARLRAAVSDRVFEARIAAAQPAELYAAFVHDLVARYKEHDLLQRMNPVAWEQLEREDARLRRSEPGVRSAGEALLDEMSRLAVQPGPVRPDRAGRCASRSC